MSGPLGHPGTLGGAHQHLQGWLPTGDLGLLWDGELYITGRIKDLIILNGRNLHPQSLEWGVGELEGVRKGNVVAFSVAGSQSEQLVMALETRLEGAEERRALETAVRAQISREWGLELHGVALLEPGQLPKTSSGKLQRHRARAQYLAGSLGREGSRGLEESTASVSLDRSHARLGCGPTRLLHPGNPELKRQARWKRPQRTEPNSEAARSWCARRQGLDAL